MRELVINWIKSFYSLSKDAPIEYLLDHPDFGTHKYFWALGIFIIVLMVSYVLWFLTRQILLTVVNSFAKRTKTQFDDLLVQNKFFRGVAHLVPLLLFDYFFSIVFFAFPDAKDFSVRINDVLIIFVVLVSLRRLVKTLGDMISRKPVFEGKPISAYVQTVNIVLTIIFSIIMLSVLTKQSPTFFLTSLGAMTAILLLIFKDTILGFVSSIQLSANDMVRIGDWVTMEKFGADGDVVEINLTTVKVQNFDKTITTIPTYNLISDSFKNWRGMSESGGRRIKRAVNIQIDSVKFASPELLERLSKIKLLSEFIQQRQEEIRAHNESMGLDESQINARRQTNLGLFRRYLDYYLQNKPEIHQEMSIMVRQMTPGDNGIPIEIYCFTNTTSWTAYESIMADIFDHIFSVVKSFDLRIFESPSGEDIRMVVGDLKAKS
jgi:miniconductance mechanosensitive channel